MHVVLGLLPSQCYIVIHAFHHLEDIFTESAESSFPGGFWNYGPYEPYTQDPSRILSNTICGYRKKQIG